MTERKLSNWLDSYLDYTTNQESPEKLHFWTGLCALSAALKRQISMDRGFYALYPNLYVIVVGQSARVRKSIATNIGVKLVREAVPDLFYIDGSMTPEGLISHMNRANVIITDGHKTVQYDSHMFIYADELAELFGFDRSRASRLTILLTKIYGCPPKHLHTTAGEGQKELFNLYPTWLAATDPRNLKVLPEEAVAGLIGRTIFVTESQRRKRVAWPRPSAEEQMLYDLLKYDLHTISQLHGVMTPTNEARALFENWYNSQPDDEVGDPHIDAFRERCHDTALKLAMLFSLAKSNDLVVEEREVQRGIDYVEKQLGEFSKVAGWSKDTDFAQNKAKLIELLKANSGAGMRKLALRALNISLDEIVQLESSMEQEGLMVIRMSGKNIYYKLSEKEMRR